MTPRPTPDVEGDSVLERLRALEDDRDIRDTVMRMVGLVDERDWKPLLGLFTPTVRADWSRLTGDVAGEVSAHSLVDGWRRTLSGLTAVQHLLGNVLVVSDGQDIAHASAYVHAAQRLDAEFASSLWIVAGKYEFELERTEGRWLISAATYVPAWGWGNRQIMAMAAEAQPM